MHRVAQAVSHRYEQQICPLRPHRRGGLSPQDLTSRQLVRSRSQRWRVMALGTEDLAQGIEKGSKIRVKSEVTIYHSPKLGESFNLEGREGTVLDIVQQYKGKKLSANLPYKVEFMVPVEGSKDVKLIAHLASTEIEAA
ncbi:g3145 [Coccomyxa elongata]